MVEKWYSNHKACFIWFYANKQKSFIAANISHVLEHKFLFCNIGESSF